MEKNFFNDVITISTVPLISQVIGLFLTPFVTRIFAPEAFGTYNYFSSIITFIAVFSTLGFHSSLILPKSNKEASNMFLVCLISNILITSLFSSIIFLFYSDIMFFVDNNTFKYYIWLCPAFIFLHGLYQTLKFWNIRLKNFKSIAISSVSESLGNKLIVITAGIFGFATGGTMIYSSLCSSIIKILFIVKSSFLDGALKLNFNSKELIKGIKKYKKFPMFSVWSEVLSRAPAIIIVSIITYYFDSSVLGNYSLAIMVVSLPSNFLTNSIMQAFLPRAALAKHEKNHVVLLKKVYERLVPIAIFPYILLALYGDFLFMSIFSTEWILAGLIAQIIVLGSIFELFFLPVFQFINIMEKQEINLLRRFFSTFAVSFSLYLGGLFYNFLLGMLIMTILSSIINVTIGVYMINLLEFPIWGVIKKIKPHLINCVLVGVFLSLIKVKLKYSFFYLYFTLMFVTIIYYSIILRKDKELRNLIFSELKILRFITKRKNL